MQTSKVKSSENFDSDDSENSDSVDLVADLDWFKNLDIKTQEKLREFIKKYHR